MINNLSINEIQEAQKHTNFVILMPILSEAYAIQNITVRKETNEQRSSIRFELHNNGRIIRVKQFFYDWAIPVITADTNLISQGESFEIDGIIGFIGIDYKGHQAACFSKWFTTIEVSVLTGNFDEEEIITIFKSLKVVDKDAIHKIGKQSFSTCSHTARFNLPKWDSYDEITRVSWYESKESNLIEKSRELGIELPQFHNEYYLDSIGYKSHYIGEEFHFLYRSEKDYTNGFWLWIAPKGISDPLPSKMGRKVGGRQSWNVKKVGGSTLHIPINEVVLCRQNTKYKSWMLHWESDNKIYHFYSRASMKNNIRDIRAFLLKLYAR
ncbi:MAG: hypothetical protein ABS944_05880 [Solibacillus sp.]|uniref:hypothetical protein n=1 Tax=unclassified Solibacillus TaxID=2637870 RepID=UPI0030F508DE